MQQQIIEISSIPVVPMPLKRERANLILVFFLVLMTIGAMVMLGSTLAKWRATSATFAAEDGYSYIVQKYGLEVWEF